MVKLTNRAPDSELGLVTGFRYNGGAYLSEYYGAAIFDSVFAQGKLCAYGNKWPSLTNDLVTQNVKSKFLCFRVCNIS